MFTKNIVVAEHAFILCFQIMGVLAGNIILPIRSQLLYSERRYKEIEWSLRSLKPKKRVIISKLGLYQSLAFEFVLILSFIDFWVIFPEINKTCVMMAAFEYNNWLLTGVLYFLEIGDVLTMCYFVLMVPNLHTYFALKAEVQIFLLTQYVNSLNEYLRTHKGRNQEQIVKFNLRLIYNRYCEIKQVYVDIRDAVSSAGIKYVLPSSLITIFIVYAAVEGNLSIVTLVMHFVVFSTVLIITIISGQRYEDEWKHFYESLCKLPWYTWSLRNQKSYLIMITGSSKIVQLIILETIVVNYSLFIKVGRFLYTGANMIFSLHRK
ncbi:uncharacterized protein LOC126734323 [Anthonomus grandis grandis]|uniref:uncharacterized protein LOC126734323 n=1 Tax=Anthonomus grandis grandis TaxID=2921223 RepID=UPI002165C982|nr:uncharacterized protein LOC126734323 [Anthonomus grandis grandis]